MGNTAVGLMPVNAAAGGGVVDYWMWNRALGGAFFNSDRAGQLVYLDQDDDAFANACEMLGMDSGGRAQASLADAVRSMLRWRSSQRTTFAEFDMMTKRWLIERRAALRTKHEVRPPPHIALLMLLSMAAEGMGAPSAKGEPHTGGYYAQLEKLLKIPEGEALRLRTSFAESSEAYWEALSVWLEDHGGNLGLPSAYALMYRYVGLPISQALIRDTERRNLEKFFDEQGFVAGAAVSHAEMQASIDIWVHTVGGSANPALRKIWSAPGNQSRVTDLALAQFAAWNGPSGGGQEGQLRSRSARCLLTWRSERKFLTRTSKFGLIVMQGVAENGTGTVEAENGTNYEVQFRPTGNNTFGVSFGEQDVEALSLVGGDVTITTSENRVLRRIPKKVVLFARDVLTASYVEIDRALSGTETRILIQQSEKLEADVERILEDAAQTGYRKIDGGAAEGIPFGWTGYLNVMFLRSPAPELLLGRDLFAFQPRLATQMAVQGGLRLPGRTNRWSAAAPLTLIITSDEGELVDLYRVERDPDSLRNVEVNVGSGLQPPLELLVDELSGGCSDFAVSLRRNGNTLQNMRIRLRGSGIGAANSVLEPRGIAHGVGTPLWPLTAIAGSDMATGWVEGTTIESDPIEVETGGLPVPTQITWSRPLTRVGTRQRLRLPGPALDSCIVTGLHRFQLPTFDGKYPKAPWMYGECLGCGMSKRFPTRFKQVQKVEGQAMAVRKVLPSSSVHSSDIDWAAVLDALVYLGNGTRRDFSVLARQLEDSALFERQLLNALEALAFLELERNERLEVTSWEVVYKGIAGLENGSWILAGSWTYAEKQQLGSSVEEAGGDMFVVGPVGQGTTGFEGIVREAIPFVTESLIESDYITPRAARKMAKALPPLSQITGELRRQPLPTAAFYEYFKLESASWVEVEVASLPGLYRLPRINGSGYFLRTAADIVAGTQATVWAELGKHLAANILGRPLLAYNSETNMLRVPLGAELPGLYGRAAVLASGHLPVSERRLNSLSYTGICPETASILIGKLTS